MTLRLLSYNIRYGGRGRETPISAVIEKLDPDVVILQEATNPGVVARVAGENRMKYWGSTPGHSVGYMSRIEVRHHEWHKHRWGRRAMLEVELAGSATRLFGVHLSPVHSNWMEQRRVHELQGMLRAIAQYQEGFHVLVGDFNTLAPGERLDLHWLPPHLRFIAVLGGGAIRWQTVQIMLDADYADGFRLLHPDDKGHTFPTWSPHVRIDYVFVPRGAAARLTRCEVVNGPTAVKASDHFPVLAELDI
jgi:exodeoxyribonuclease-3